MRDEAQRLRFDRRRRGPAKLLEQKDQRIEQVRRRNSQSIPQADAFRDIPQQAPAKPASLLAFLTFNRFACIALFNPVEPNSEVNGHHGHQAKPPSKTVMQANTNPEQLSLPRQ